MAFRSSGRDKADEKESSSGWGTSIFKGMAKLLSPSATKSSSSSQQPAVSEPARTPVNGYPIVETIFDPNSPGAVSYGTTLDLLLADETSPTLEDIGVSYETLRAMLLREEELRLSPETQAQHKAKGQSAYPEVSAECQERVAREFGFTDARTSFGVQLLRCAESLVRRDPERLRDVQTISFYRRFNRLQDGGLKEGDPAPLLPRALHAFTDEMSPVPFESLVHSEMPRPLLLLAGSYS